MNLHQFDFEETNRFSSIFLDYINNKTELQNFFDQIPSVESFEKVIEHKKFNSEKRNILVKTLYEQYKTCAAHDAVANNIASLAESKTFTITTGHQLNIFTGPLFFIYKIVAVINMAKTLNEKYPGYNIVPVYWMASEDHDFEEINNFNLFGKKYTWESDQKGPVGKFETASMKALIDELPEKLGFCETGYLKHNNLSEATRYIVNHLFGKYGLVIIDADEIELKKQLRPVIKDDILQNSAHKLTRQASERLEGMGYKSQIFPRPINFFYMEDGLRERIEEEKGKYKILNTSQSYSKKEIESLIEKHPERFSPNVVLRPVYQEMILPNLAYIGGPAEVAYWLQLKDIFDHYLIPFPIVFPRLFVMIIPSPIAKKMSKLELENRDIFEEYSVLKEKILYNNVDPTHDLTNQLKEVEKTFESIRQKSVEIDRSLEGFVASEHKKVEKGIENIQKRLKKAEEQKEEIKLKQLQGILDKLFPNGNPQEREDNFLSFYINNPEFIDELIDQLDPFELKYNILSEDA